MTDNNDYRDKRDGMDDAVLGKGALSSTGVSWEAAAPPLHSSSRSSLTTPVSETEIPISTADGEGNGHTGGGGDGK